jgi:glutathionylspermidine synthase
VTSGDGPALVVTAPIRALAVALARWQHAAGDYWPFLCAAPFVSTMEWLAWQKVRVREARLPRLGNEPPERGIPDHCPPTELSQVIDRALATADQTAIFVDLPLATTLPATASLNWQGFFVLPIVQRWVAWPAVLDCSLLVEQLIDHSRSCRAPRAPRGVVFLLDGERAGPPGARGASTRFDNRYAYSGCLFPSAKDLIRRGIDAVEWVGPDVLAPDLSAYASELVGAGLQPIEIRGDQGCPHPNPLPTGEGIDLARFGRLDAESRKAGPLSPRERVRVREPILRRAGADGAGDARRFAPRYRRFIRRAQCGALLADNLVRGEPYLAQDPYVLTTADDACLRRLTDVFAVAFDRAARAVAGDVPALEAMGFPWVAAQLLQTEAFHQPVIGRFDFVKDTAEHWWLVEYNADTPSGIREAIGGEAAALAIASHAGRFARPTSGLRDAIACAFVEARRELSPGSTLGLVTNAGELEDVGQLAFIRHLIADSLADRGVRVAFGDVDNLRSRRSGLYVADVRVDALYRLFPFESTFGTTAFAAIYDAVAAGHLVLLNGLFGLLLQHKGLLAWLWAHRADPALPPEERAAIQEHLAPTWPIGGWNPGMTPRDQQPAADVVVKQVFGREGEEVFLGSALTAEQWHAFQQRQTYVVQCRVPVGSRTLVVPTWAGARTESGYATVGSFVVDGRWAGYYSRFGGAITDASAKWLPTLVEQ